MQNSRTHQVETSRATLLPGSRHSAFRSLELVRETYNLGLPETRPQDWVQNPALRTPLETQP